MSSTDDDTLKHAAIGAAVSLVLSFVPFAPALGGGVAAYLHGPDRSEGAKVGGLSGLLAAVPGALLLTLVAAFFVIAGPGQRSGLLVAAAFFLVALVISSLYFGALGAVGGFVGALLNEEFDGPGSTRVTAAGERSVERARIGQESVGERSEGARSVREDDAREREADDATAPEMEEFDEPVGDRDRGR